MTPAEIAQAAAERVTLEIAAAMGIKAPSAVELAQIAEVVVGTVQILTGQAEKRANAAGEAAAALITNEDEAEKAESERT